MDTTGSAFLGLTFKCARCHDHKFDPIAEKDYYRLQAVFAASLPGQIPVVTDLSAGKHNEAEMYLLALDEARTAYLNFQKQVIDRAMKVKEKEYPPEATTAYDLLAIFRTPHQSAMAKPLDEYAKTLKVEDLMTPAEKATQLTLTENIAKAVVAIPLNTGFDGNVNYENFYEVPSATVLKDLPLELLPTT